MIPWLIPLRAALARNRRDRAVQVATLSPAGWPEVRTVILRGLSDRGELYFFSDARSSKIRALEECGRLELCSWWRKTNEQFRLRGEVELICDGSNPTWSQQRQLLWQSQNPDNRALFLGAAPGTPLSDVSPETSPESVNPFNSTEPPEHFILVVLTPDHVDYLKLAHPHERVLYTRTTEGWREELVVA